MLFRKSDILYFLQLIFSSNSILRRSLLVSSLKLKKMYFHLVWTLLVPFSSGTITQVPNPSGAWLRILRRCFSKLLQYTWFSALSSIDFPRRTELPKKSASQQISLVNTQPTLVYLHNNVGVFIPDEDKSYYISENIGFCAEAQNATRTNEAEIVNERFARRRKSSAAHRPWQPR